MDDTDHEVRTPRDTRFTINKWRNWGLRRLYLQVDDVGVAYLDEETGIAYCWATEYLDDVRRQWPQSPVELTNPPKKSRAQIPAQRKKENRGNSPGARLMVVAQSMVKARGPGAAIPWLIGALGEQLVGTSLSKTLCPMGWTVLHSLQPFGGTSADIDHLVIGICGVWCVNTKTHPQSEVTISATDVTIGSRRTQYLAEVRSEAAAVKRWLDPVCGFSVPVFPALALVAPVVCAESAPPPDVTVWHTDFGAGLVRRPPRLTRDQVALVRAAALSDAAGAAA